MNRRVTSAMEAVRIVGERPDPLEPLAVGAIAHRLGLPLSGASRLCADLERTGLLERGDAYGSYRLGARAVRISGRAAAPTAQAVRLALTRASQQTGETVCLAAWSGPEVRIVAAVVSAWTLYAPAEVGERVDDASAIVAALVARPAEADGAVPAVAESTTGMRVEIAMPVRDPAGRAVAVVAVRLPGNRERSGAARARRAVDAARRHLESALTAPSSRLPDVHPVGLDEEQASGLGTAARVLAHLADGPDTVARTARALGLRADRTQRLVESCTAAGLLRSTDGIIRATWGVHAWHRAAATPILTGAGARLVAATARATGQCSFLTTLRGMRSVTLVEELESPGDGVVLAPWLGRPCPIVYADGGPTLLIDFDVDDIPALLPGSPPRAEVDELLERVGRVAADGVLTKGSAEEAGQIAISSPVRDASGIVVAAACIVGTTDTVRVRTRELERAVQQLAAGVSSVLGYRGATLSAAAEPVAPTLERVRLGA
jgi:DNA-binding IclR family transcriptional regulator